MLGEWWMKKRRGRSRRAYIYSDSRARSHSRGGVGNETQGGISSVADLIRLFKNFWGADSNSYAQRFEGFENIATSIPLFEAADFMRCKSVFFSFRDTHQPAHSFVLVHFLEIRVSALMQEKEDRKRDVYTRRGSVAEHGH